MRRSLNPVLTLKEFTTCRKADWPVLWLGSSTTSQGAGYTTWQMSRTDRSPSITVETPTNLQPVSISLFRPSCQNYQLMSQHNHLLSSYCWWIARTMRTKPSWATSNLFTGWSTTTCSYKYQRTVGYPCAVTSTPGRANARIAATKLIWVSSAG